ncbi:hypothetical protein EVAR_2963_1 [Eumeta japonica]|uniref:Uncharacterized protein n=1 Tax=Eumeta variegata TaxID=151549 RepID=A0A4C1T216_EUMVA|nr:hypothetical protein EVAR_2963_1 [Eumeta japonica]
MDIHREIVYRASNEVKLSKDQLKQTIIFQRKQLTKQLKFRLCAAAISFLLGRIGRWSGREIDASQAERLGQSCLFIACSMLSLAHSAKAERDNESCFFVRAASVHRFIRRYQVKKDR